jgi:hypothetical protein
MTTPTTPESIKLLNTTIQSIERSMSHFYIRWLDEREYEDIKDYQVAIQSQLPSNFNITKMNKKPFGFNFNIGTDAKYQVFINSKSYGWKRLK